MSFTVSARPAPEIARREGSPWIGGLCHNSGLKFDKNTDNEGQYSWIS